MIGLLRCCSCHSLRKAVEGLARAAASPEVLARPRPPVYQGRGEPDPVIPRRQGRAKIIAAGGAAGAGSLAGPSGPQIQLLPDHSRVPAAGAGASSRRPVA